MQKWALLVLSVLAADFAEMSLGISWTLQNHSLSSRLDLHLQNRVGISANQAQCLDPRQKSHRQNTSELSVLWLTPFFCELDLQLWNKSSLQDQLYLKIMHTAFPQHGREIKGLCLFSVNVRPYSVKNPHIDSFILPSMHYMPTCFQQKWYICEWSWPCERKSVQNVENQASVTQGKKERQLWRQKHSTVQGQSQPIECRFFFVLCSFTLSACLVPSACWHLSYCVILAGWGSYNDVV